MVEDFLVAADGSPLQVPDCMLTDWMSNLRAPEMGRSISRRGRFASTCCASARLFWQTLVSQAKVVGQIALGAYSPFQEGTFLFMMYAM